MNDIAAYHIISQNTASEHIKRIMKKGFLQKQRDPADERKWNYCSVAIGEFVKHYGFSYK